MTKKEIEIENFMSLAEGLTLLRAAFPDFAGEIDRCTFEIGKRLDKCGDAMCDCHILTFEEFHLQRNICFGTTASERGKTFEVR